MRQQLSDMQREKGQLSIQLSHIETLWKEEQDKNKKMHEIEKIICDIKMERDLLIRQLEQNSREHELLLANYAQLKDETDKLL